MSRPNFTPLAHRQHVQMELVCTPGPHGYRVGFAEGFGVHYLTDLVDVTEAHLSFPSPFAARDAHQAGLASLDFFKKERA